MTGQVTQSLMQSKPVAGTGGWSSDFTLTNMTESMRTRFNSNTSHFLLGDDIVSAWSMRDFW